MCMYNEDERVIFASKFLLFFSLSAIYGFSLNLCKEKKSVFLCRLATGVGPLAAVFSAPLQRWLSRTRRITQIISQQ